MEHIVALDKVVTGFAITEMYIDCMGGKGLSKFEKRSGNLVFSKEIFEREGFSRNLMAHNRQIFIYDFCTLYVLNQSNFDMLCKLQLGTDLTFDICGMLVNERTVYCSMRNGTIIAVDRQSFEQREVAVSESSIWCIKEYKEQLVCGTVDGKVLLLNRETLSIEKMLEISRQNVKCMYIDKDTLYAACQDKKLYKINLQKFEVDIVRRNAHKKAYECVGLYKDMLVTVSYPCSAISFWDKSTLEMRKEVHVSLALWGHSYIEDEYLYIASRNILGIDKMGLKELVTNQN